MKQATISLPDDLGAALEAYVRDQNTTPDVAAVAQAALREYLGNRGYIPRAHTLRITPATQGSGSENASVDHDRYLADV